MKRRPITLRPSAFAFAAAIASVGLPVAAAHDAPPGSEASPAVANVGAPRPETTASSRWQGSILLFDQSVTTQTVGVGGDYQSYDPTYEWWIAFKPRYTLVDRPADQVSLNLWMNLYLELTNSDTTTEAHELLLGPTYLWAAYGHVFRERGGYRTSASIGPRVTLPTDKASYDIGELFELGAIGSVAQTFRLAGEGARAMNGARLAVGAIYAHPFDRYTSPVNGDLHRLREDVAGLSVIDNQLSGEMNVRDSLSLSFSGDLRILRRLDLSLSYVVINQWRYAPTSAEVTSLKTGPAAVMSNADPTTYGVKTWLTASVTYDLVDALSVSVGYYNLANQLALDGTRRDPLWSPSARLFLTFTSNLDAVYRRLAAR